MKKKTEQNVRKNKIKTNRKERVRVIESKIKKKTLKIHLDNLCVKTP